MKCSLAKIIFLLSSQTIYMFTVDNKNTRLMCWIFSANIYLLKGDSRNTRKKYEICSVLKNTPERCRWRFSGVFFLTLRYFTPFSGVSIVEFEQINVCWVMLNMFKVNSKDSRMFSLSVEKEYWPKINQLWLWTINSLLALQLYCELGSLFENYHFM